MIKPILCGSQQSSFFNKTQRHGLVKSMQKSFIRSGGSNQSSQTKEKRSLKSITNKQTKPIVSSQFKKQAKQLSTIQKTKDQARFQTNNQVGASEKQKHKNSLNSYFSLKQNRRNFQSVNYHHPQNYNQDKNNLNQNVQLLPKDPITKFCSFQKGQVNYKKPQLPLQVRNFQSDFKQKNLKKVQSLIFFQRQKSKSARVSFLNKSVFDSIQKDKYSLKHHFSFANFKSPLNKYQNDSKAIESTNKSEINRPFLRNTLTFQPIKRNQVSHSIKTQRQRVSLKNQDTQKSKFFTPKKSHLKFQQKKQRIQTEQNQQKTDENKGLTNQNTASMSRFFSMKTSRFFTPKRQQNEMQLDQKKKQETIQGKNLQFQIQDSNSQVSKNNQETKKQKQRSQITAHIQNQMQLQKESNLTDSTKVSTFFDINNWKKRQIQNRFTQVNDSFMESRFGFSTQPLSDGRKHTNFSNSQLKSRVSQGNFIYIQNNSSNSQEKLTEEQKIQKNLTILKRNTINHQPTHDTFTLNRSQSTKSSFMKNLIQKKHNKQTQKPIDASNQTTKFERSGKQRPSFFVDLQRKKQQQKTLRRQIGKVILQKEEQQNLQSDKIKLFSNIQIKDAESVADSQFNNSQKDSELQFVLHSTDKIQLKSFAFLNTLQPDKKNFFKYK